MAATETSRCTPDPCDAGCRACADLRRAAVALAGAMGLEGVTAERLAQVAGVDDAELAAHACGAVESCVAAAYEELHLDLQARYAAHLRAASTRNAGLRAATRDLLAHLARRPDIAAFVTLEVFKGGRELLELRERLRRGSVASVRRELVRFDGDAVASELQIEMLVAATGHIITRAVETGRTSTLLDVLEPVLALAPACEPMPALG